MNRNEFWTDERVEQLKKYWIDGLSAGQIAARLGGVSRNAVIGKANRVGLRGHVRAPRHGGGTSAKTSVPVIKQVKQPKPVKIARPPVLKSVPMPPPPAHLPEPTPLNLTLVELKSNDCRWPISGEKAAMLFCGHEAVARSSYCLCHHNRSIGQGTRSERAVAAIVKQVA